MDKLTAEQSALVVGAVDLAAYLAKVYWEKNQDQIDLREVTSVAFQGLVMAASRWDPETFEKTEESLANGRAFSGYARRRIIGSILDWQRSSDHVPKRQRKTYKNLQQHGLGNGRSHEQLAELTGMDLNKIRAITHAVEATTVSLDSDPSDWDTAQHPTEKPGLLNTEATALENTMMEAVVRAFRNLPDLERSIIALRYYEGHELSAVATMLGAGLPTVRAAHNDAILVIHQVMLDHTA